MVEHLIKILKNVGAPENNLAVSQARFSQRVDERMLVEKAVFRYDRIGLDTVPADRPAPHRNSRRIEPAAQQHTDFDVAAKPQFDAVEQQLAEVLGRFSRGTDAVYRREIPIRALAYIAGFERNDDVGARRHLANTFEERLSRMVA